MLFCDEIIDVFKSLDKRQLGCAISQLENFSYRYPELSGCEEIQRIKENYRLMLNYWGQGYDDPSLEGQYSLMLQQVFRLASDIGMKRFYNDHSLWRFIQNRIRYEKNSFTFPFVKTQLESFTTDVVLLDLEAEHVRDAKQKELYARHQSFMTDLFDYILTSDQWNESVCTNFQDVILTPTVSSNDQQLIVSAIMLNIINAFDINKFKLLVDVYRNSSDESVRQRAFVGWVFAAVNGNDKVFPELKTIVKDLLADTKVVDDMLELQIQLMYCVNAETDHDTIQKEIMPDLLKHNNFNITKNGIEEIEDDPMADILDSDSSERNIERVEEGFRKMIDMQKAGSDIYFGGFSQMKRFSFFDTISNWFIPFYFEHPGISHVLGSKSQLNVFKGILNKGPFCNSDKYSFVLALQQVVSNLPANVKEMLNSETFAADNVMPIDWMNTPAYIRRVYLQDIYRFYRIYHSRNLFQNPFLKQDGVQGDYLFFSKDIFSDTSLEQKFSDFVLFLMRKRLYSDAVSVLNNYHTVPNDYQYHVLCGNLLMRLNVTDRKGALGDKSACEYFEKALEQKSDIKVMKNYARSLFYDGKIGKAKGVYRTILDETPDDSGVALSYSVCLTNLGEYEEALSILYRLNYENPDNVKVSRVLARALVGCSKYEQAHAIYQKILENPAVDDYLNAGYCMWFDGKILKAAEMFKKYLSSAGWDSDSMTLRKQAEESIIDIECDYLEKHGVGAVEKELMLDIVCDII